MHQPYMSAPKTAELLELGLEAIRRFPNVKFEGISVDAPCPTENYPAPNKPLLGLEVGSPHVNSLNTIAVEKVAFWLGNTVLPAQNLGTAYERSVELPDALVTTRSRMLLRKYKDIGTNTSEAAIEHVLAFRDLISTITLAVQKARIQLHTTRPNPYARLALAYTDNASYLEFLKSYAASTWNLPSTVRRNDELNKNRNRAETSGTQLRLASTLLLASGLLVEFTVQDRKNEHS